MDIPELSSLLKVVGKDVEHELGVRVGVDMPVSLGVECLPESGGVDQVTVLQVSMAMGALMKNVHGQSRYRKES